MLHLTTLLQLILQRLIESFVFYLRYPQSLRKIITQVLRLQDLLTSAAQEKDMVRNVCYTFERGGYLKVISMTIRY